MSLPTPTQLELVPEETIEADVAMLVRALTHAGWLTRKQLHVFLGWDERHIRAVAEAAGDRIVRGPKGFCLFGEAGTDDILHCVRILESQSTKMSAYAVALRQRLHGRIE